LVVRELTAAFRAATGLRQLPLDYCVAHRWRFAQPAAERDLECLWDSKTTIGAGGDWCYSKGRIESAFLSGSNLVDRVLTRDKAHA
jgi:predicted NAD/FAD-dependent oxidoreductase